MKKKNLPAGWFLLLSKRQLKKPGLYLLAGMLVLFLYIFDSLVLPGEHTLSYGILNDGSVCGDSVIADLKTDTLYTPVVLSSRSALEREVGAGRLDCGFILTGKLDSAAGPENLDGSVQYICSTSTARGAVLKDKIYGAIVRETTKKMLLNIVSEGVLVPDGDVHEFTDSMLMTYDNYLTGDDTIHIIYETIETDSQPDSRESSIPLSLRRFSALCSILIFTATVVFARTRFSSASKRITLCLTPRRRRLWRFMEVLSPSVLVTLIVLIPSVIWMSRGGLPAGRILYASLSRILLSVVASLWSFAYASLFRKEAYYISSIPVLLLLCAATDPVITGGIPLGRVLFAVGHLFPTQWLPVL
ncbi:MAG: hypothetical protein IJ123_10250 [Blautia sp.]|nr:hypothetical protein [Blautia sp.]